MKKILAIALLSLLPILTWTDASWAGEAKELAGDTAEDVAVEKRMVALAENLRCLVCQNESLASSHAELAEDLRREVREQIRAGKSDQEITEYLVARYGDFVLYEPPMKSYTVLLWFGPFALLLVGASVLFYQLRQRRKTVPETQLSTEAQKRATALLNEEEKQ
jgi:cytochrome c-type biogenesis protein CcmH